MGTPQGPPQLLDLPKFASCVGRRFRVDLGSGGDGPVELELVEAEALPKGHGPREPFTLLFRGPGDVLLPQRTYTLGHDALGDHEIFLVPLGPDADGHRYEAVFN